MKLLTLLAATLFALNLSAQTNTNIFSNAPLAADVLGAGGKEFGNYELTLGGGGESIHGQNTFALDLSLATNPLKVRPEVWFGIAQSLYWEPTFAGATDLYADWAFNIWKEKLYLDTGWSVGALYSNKALETWRTGPEVTFEYYTKGNAFLFAGVNYDVWQSTHTSNGFRYSFGIGITF